MNMQRAPKLQWLKFSAMLLVVGAFISILIYVLVARDELVKTNADVPLITPAETPVKRRPENPGGLDIPNRDRVVFDLLANPENNIAAVADATQTPVQPEVVALTLEEAAPVVEAVVTQPAQAAAVVNTPAPVASAPTPATDAIAALLTTPESTKAATPAPAVATATNGQFGVQLASFALKQDADKAAQGYAKKHAALLGNLTTDIQRADLGAKGIRYRVRFVGAGTRSAANQICRDLKAKGQGCLAISR